MNSAMMEMYNYNVILRGECDFTPLNSFCITSLMILTIWYDSKAYFPILISSLLVHSVSSPLQLPSDKHSLM